LLPRKQKERPPASNAVTVLHVRVVICRIKKAVDNAAWGGYNSFSKLVIY
jgi:hypothetical protein